MKKKFIIILNLFVCGTAFSQNSYQVFTASGFKVKCDCILKANSLFIKMAKEQGVNNIIGAYVCASNEDNPDIAVIVNINIYDDSKSYNNIKPSEYSSFEKDSFKQYASKLSSSGMQYNYTTYKGITALEYTFEQMGLNTKAIMFFKNKKSYLLQIATNKELSIKYSELKDSFTIL